jgi:hypothetical protein
MKVRDVYKIKVTRAVLKVWAGDECHYYSKDGYKVVYRTDKDSPYGYHEWPEVMKNVRALCTEHGLGVQVKDNVINIELTI